LIGLDRGTDSGPAVANCSLMKEELLESTNIITFLPNEVANSFTVCGALLPCTVLWPKVITECPSYQRSPNFATILRQDVRALWCYIDEYDTSITHFVT
jgi:hypothetical protein